MCQKLYVGLDLKYRGSGAAVAQELLKNRVHGDAAGQRQEGKGAARRQ